MSMMGYTNSDKKKTASVQEMQSLPSVKVKPVDYVDSIKQKLELTKSVASAPAKNLKVMKQAPA